MPQTANPLRRKSQTIERAGIILSCFSETRPHLSLSEFASELGLNVNTVYRYVASLQTASLLRRDARRGGYSLGLRIIELAGIALNQIEVRKQALDEMDRLRDELGLLVNLGVLFEGDVLHLAHAAPKDLPRMYTSLGRRAVAYCTASGKTLLAYRPWAETLRLIEEYGWRPYTAKSIRGMRALQAELAKTQKRGYGLDREERRQGVVCVAAPIREQSGEVTAALSVSGSTERLTSRFCLKVAPRVIDTANRISYRLGYHGSSAYL